MTDETQLPPAQRMKPGDWVVIMGYRATMARVAKVMPATFRGEIPNALVRRREDCVFIAPDEATVSFVCQTIRDAQDNCDRVIIATKQARDDAIAAVLADAQRQIEAMK